MIYIDLHCSQEKREEWKKWCKENDIDAEDEPDCRTGYWERGSQVMSYYFRLLCIAAYRRVNDSKKEMYEGIKKSDILDTLLQVCPADSGAISPDREDKGTMRMENMMNNHIQQMLMMRRLGLGGASLMDMTESEEKRYHRRPRVDMQALAEDQKVRAHLTAIGLLPMINWIRFGCQTENYTGVVILQCAEMFTHYLADVPEEEADLKGTPYGEVKEENMCDNLDNNGCVEFKETLEPAFRNTAQFGPGCSLKHC